jgi:uncharacterized protein (TIGR02594 family)
MGPIQKRLTLALCGVALAVFTTQALAKPQHRRHVGHHRNTATAAAATAPALRDGRYSALSAAPARESRPRTQRGRLARAPAKPERPAIRGGSSTLVDEARRYLGGNPTGRGSLWCGAFMDMVLKRTGHPGGGNLARAYARYGTPVSGPEVGAIAVMGRHGGGHVGVVSGVDASGNPIIISGNHNSRVAESVYPRGRIITYVMPN